MRKVLWFTTTLFLCQILYLTPLIAHANNCPASSATEIAWVDTVIDGDTIKLKDGRKVRLIGVNTPEIGHKGSPNQPFAKAAKSFTRTFIGGEKSVNLQIGNEAHDRYGRLLAHLFNVRGENLEAALLANGLAYHIAIPPNLENAQCLANQEKNARINKLGLWRDSLYSAQPSIQPFIREVAPGYRRIIGTVGKLTFGKSWWISFKEPELNRFVAVIHKKNQVYFNQQQVSTWIGTTIETEGWVYKAQYQDKNQLRMDLLTQFSVTQLN